MWSLSNRVRQPVAQWLRSAKRRNNPPTNAQTGAVSYFIASAVLGRRCRSRVIGDRRAREH